MYDLQIAYLSSNQRWTHMVRFLCCFAVKKLEQNKSVGVLIVCHFLSSLSWRGKWRVSWFNDFIGRFSLATKPRPLKLANFIDHLTAPLGTLTSGWLVLCKALIGKRWARLLTVLCSLNQRLRNTLWTIFLSAVTWRKFKCSSLMYCLY